MNFSKPAQLRIIFPPAHVSILVLMDEFLEVNHESVNGRNTTFQSLFSWMNFSKLLFDDYCAAILMFQSLFSWMNFSKRFQYDVLLYNVRFQSLFSWMNFSKYTTIPPARPTDLFQSLFSWMNFSKMATIYPMTLGINSFNPCSLG